MVLLLVDPFIFSCLFLSTALWTCPSNLLPPPSCQLFCRRPKKKNIKALYNTFAQPPWHNRLPFLLSPPKWTGNRHSTSRAIVLRAVPYFDLPSSPLSPECHFTRSLTFVGLVNHARGRSDLGLALLLFGTWNNAGQVVVEGAGEGSTGSPTAELQSFEKRRLGLRR